MYPILIEIGPVKIYSFGVLVFAAFALCYIFAHRDFRAENLGTAELNSLFAVAGIAGFIGARLLFLLENSTVGIAELSHLHEMKSGLTWYGGLSFGGFASFIYLTRWKQNMPLILDIIVPLVLLGYAIGRMGCQLAGDGDYGPSSELPWAMAYPRGMLPVTVKVHPTPLYDMIIAAGFFILIRQRRKKLYRGESAWLAILALGLTRFFTEFFRNTPPWLWGYFTTAHLMSAGMITVAIVGLSLMKKNNLK